jgi:hypothetical protein
MGKRNRGCSTLVVALSPKSFPLIERYQLERQGSFSLLLPLLWVAA